MTRPNEEADRLWIQASQLRLIADEMEARAAALRPSRTPLDHGRYFRLLAERDCDRGSGCDHRACTRCSYCEMSVHPFEATHSRVEHDTRFCGGPSDIIRICEGVGGRCAHVDHVLPVALGGTNETANLVLACWECNSRKGSRSAEAFRRQLFLEEADEWSTSVAPSDFDHGPMVSSFVTYRMVELLDRLLAPDERPGWYQQLRAIHARLGTG